MTFRDDDFKLDTTFDPDDVDLTDLVELSTGIHGTMCPEVHDYTVLQVHTPTGIHYVMGVPKC